LLIADRTRMANGSIPLAVSGWRTDDSPSLT